MNPLILFKVDKFQVKLTERWKEVIPIIYRGYGNTEELDRFGSIYLWLCRFLPYHVESCIELNKEIRNTIRELREDKRFDYFYWDKVLPFRLGQVLLKDYDISGWEVIGESIGNLAHSKSGYRYYVAECLMWFENRFSFDFLNFAAEKNIEREQGSYVLELACISDKWKYFTKDSLAKMVEYHQFRKSDAESFIKGDSYFVKNNLLPCYTKTVQDVFQFILTVISDDGVFNELQMDLFPSMRVYNYFMFAYRKTNLSKGGFWINCKDLKG